MGRFRKKPEQKMDAPATAVQTLSLRIWALIGQISRGMCAKLDAPTLSLRIWALIDQISRDICAKWGAKKNGNVDWKTWK